METGRERDGGDAPDGLEANAAEETAVLGGCRGWNCKISIIMSFFLHCSLFLFGDYDGIDIIWLVVMTAWNAISVL
jgi:hypothetical protein